MTNDEATTENRDHDAPSASFYERYNATMTNHALNLRLLAHPFTGGLDLDDAERLMLIDAAKRIEELEELVATLVNAIA